MKLSFTRTVLLRQLSIFFVVSIWSFSTQAQEYFSVLKTADKKNEYKIACKIYYQQIAKAERNYQQVKNLDTTVVAKALKELEILATKESNKELNIIFLAFMGDFYARYDRG